MERNGLARVAAAASDGVVREPETGGAPLLRLRRLPSRRKAGANPPASARAQRAAVRRRTAVASSQAKRSASPGPAESLTIQGLDQVRALADPLRLRLLEAFHVERTTAQVAQLLEEKPTRLYHHVDALERAGLLRKTRTQRKRGTLEQYYLAAARRFVAAASLFATGEVDDQQVEAWEEIVTSLLEGTAVELRALLAAGRAGELEGEGVLAYLQLRGGAREIAKVRRALERLVRSVETAAAQTATKTATEKAAKSPPADSGSTKPAARETSSDEERAYRLTVAFFPIETPGTRGR